MLKYCIIMCVALLIFGLPVCHAFAKEAGNQLPGNKMDIHSLARVYGGECGPCDWGDQCTGSTGNSGCQTDTTGKKCEDDVEGTSCEAEDCKGGDHKVCKGTEGDEDDCTQSTGKECCTVTVATCSDVPDQGGCDCIGAEKDFKLYTRRLCEMSGS